MLQLVFCPEFGDFDLVLEGGHLAQDPSVGTRAVIALFSDQRAHRDDALPSDDEDPRGYWGDLDAMRSLGSRLWLCSAAKDTDATLRKVHMYATTALTRLVEEGHAKAVDVDVSRLRPGVVGLLISIRPSSSSPSLVTWEFEKTL